MLTSLSIERTLPFTAQEIWPVLADTALINRRLGLAPMTFETINGIRYGKQKMMGSQIRWTEQPWQWKQHEWLKNERVYLNGFFERIQGHFALTAADNGTKVFLEFKLGHKSALLAPLMNWATKSILAKLMNEIERVVANNTKHEVVKRGNTVNEWLGLAHEVERARIAPKEMARDIGADWTQTLNEVLAHHKDRLSIRFDAICPHCRGSKKSVPRLTEMPEKQVCESCQIEFSVDSQESIEVSLRDNTIPDDKVGMDFCSADVIHKPTVILQRLGEEWSETITLTSGVYNLKRKGEPKIHTFSVSESAPKLSLRLTDEWPGELLDVIHPELSITASGLPFDAFIMLEKLNTNRGALRATELMSRADFVDLIPAETLITTFPIEMGEKTILFTDVVGSTEMYFKIGDNAAFKKVRDSFVLIGNEVKKYQGILVKTIGDATMYAFTSSEDALKACLAIQKANKHGDIKLRASLHAGPCLSVNTADGQDYFGDTINICAKFQSKVEADEIVFGSAMKDKLSPEFWQELSQYSLETVPFTFKGPTTERSFTLYRVKI